MDNSAPVADKSPLRQPTTNDRIEISGSNVAVVCRFRPLNDKELGTS
jgi:hypothetical protein